jgi:hypothetical protein
MPGNPQDPRIAWDGLRLQLNELIDGVPTADIRIDENTPNTYEARRIHSRYAVRFVRFEFFPGENPHVTVNSNDTINPRGIMIISAPFPRFVINGKNQITRDIAFNAVHFLTK